MRVHIGLMCFVVSCNACTVSCDEWVKESAFVVKETAGSVQTHAVSCCPGAP